MIVNSNLDLEICDFFLRARARCGPGVGDLVNGTVKFAIAISVDLHTRLVAHFHVHDIVFVHIDARFHMAEIGHAHHFGPGELTGSNKALAQLAIQNSYRPVDGRINRGFGKLIPRLTGSGLRSLDLVKRAFESIFRHIVSGLRGIVLLDRNRLLVVHVIGPFEVLLRLHHRRLLLKIRCFGGADRSLLLLQQGLVGIRFDLHQQITLVHVRAINHRELGNFARHFRRNFHFRLRLNFTCRRNQLHDRSLRRLFRCHRNRLRALTRDNRANDPKQNQRDSPDENVATAARFSPAWRNDAGCQGAGLSRLRGGWAGYLLMHCGLQ